MNRQKLFFKKEYYKYNFINEMNNLWNTFADEEIEENSKNIIFYEATRYIIKSMEDGINKHFNYLFKPNPQIIHTNINDNFILCCISGGKDSLATALYYIEQGKQVLLYTLKGINKGYPEEYKAAVKISEQMNIPLIVDEIKIQGKKFFMEHPLKNQIIASCALAYCLENNLTPHISFGNYQEDINNRSNWGVNWTDNYNLWQQYNLFISNFIDNAYVYIPFYSEDEALKILMEHFELVPYYQSCLITIRNREQLRRHNQEKYKIKLLENRCGSCRKCCLEYIYFCDQNKFEYNKEYYKHCLEILKKKYEEYLGIKQNFKNLEEVYKAYFPKGKSKYFNK